MSSIAKYPYEENLLSLFVGLNITYTCSKVTEVAQWAALISSRPQSATHSGVRDDRFNRLPRYQPDRRCARLRCARSLLYRTVFPDRASLAHFKRCNLCLESKPQPFGYELQPPCYMAYANAQGITYPEYLLYIYVNKREIFISFRDSLSAVVAAE